MLTKEASKIQDVEKGIFKLSLVLSVLARLVPKLKRKYRCRLNHDWSDSKRPLVSSSPLFTRPIKRIPAPGASNSFCYIIYIMLSNALGNLPTRFALAALPSLGWPKQKTAPLTR